MAAMSYVPDIAEDKVAVGARHRQLSWSVLFTIKKAPQTSKPPPCLRDSIFESTNCLVPPASPVFAVINIRASGDASQDFNFGNVKLSSIRPRRHARDPFE
jgi:hypothetical protein